MHNVTTSRHIRSATELFLMVPLKQGFVPITELVMTYASRVTTVLSALFDLRQQKIERGFDDPIGPIERLSTIHRVQWTVLEPFDDQLHSRQIHGPQLILTSHFDSSWEDYFHELVTTGAGLLDLIFSHCEGYEGRSCAEGYEAFSGFIRRHQRPCDFMFATAPEVTVDDIRYFKAFTTGTLDPVTRAMPRIEDEAETKAEAIENAAEQHQLDDHTDQTRGAYQAIFALHDIRQRLFSDEVELGVRTGQALFDDAIRSVLEKEPEYKRLKAVIRAKQRHAALAVGAGLKARPKEPLRWVQSLFDEEEEEAKSSAAARLKYGDRPADETPKNTKPDLAHVQGNVLSAYDTAPCGALLLVRCKEPGAFRSLLDPSLYASEAANQAAKSRAEGHKTCFVNLALTYEGLKRLWLPPELLAKFPREFKEGMEERAGVLGDVSENHPRAWQRPFNQATNERIALNVVDAALIVHAPNAGQVRQEIEGLQLAAKGIEVLYELPLQRRVPEFSQPVPKELELHYRDPQSAQNKGPAEQDRRALGDFILGHRDDRGRVFAAADVVAKPASSEIFANGSFLAMRKMFEDHVAQKTYKDRALKELQARAGALEPAPTAQDVKAWIVGGKQTRDGFVHPLSLGKAHPNQFDYQDDPAGDKCPLHAHVRRANPRRSDTPRIVRRGLSYEERQPRGDMEHGLLFMAYCANLAEQYELVQRYVNGGNVTGLTSFQNDILCGSPDWGNVERLTPELRDARGEKGKLQLPARTQPLVGLRWGLYFFVPSLPSLNKLAEFVVPREEAALQELAVRAERRRAASVARGRSRLKELDRLAPSRRMHEWKRILEEVAEAGSPQAREARDIWAAIRSEKSGGAKQVLARLDHVDDEGRPIFPGGLIVVGSENLAREVLGDDGTTYSVVEYNRRFRTLQLDHYITHDPQGPHSRNEPTYAQESEEPNRIVHALRETSFKEAFENAATFLARPGDYEQLADGERLDERARSAVSIRDLARVVVAKLCVSWFGLGEKAADTQALVEALEHFLVTSRYTFQASPGDYLARQARAAVVKREHNTLADDVLVKALRESKYPYSIESAAIGAIIGFAPPAVGAITRVLDQWIENGQLWRIRAQCAAGAKPNALLRDLIHRALGRTPSPTLLYRTAIQDTQLGHVNVRAGTQVVVGLSSVYDDAVEHESPKPEAWLFGGDRESPAAKRPVHGCPARDAGADVILGIVQALFERRNLQRERRLVVSYDA